MTLTEIKEEFDDFKKKVEDHGFRLKLVAHDDGDASLVAETAEDGVVGSTTLMTELLL